MKQPTSEQLDRLNRFAAEHGTDWKDILAYYWQIGADERQADGHLLRQLRNRLGPRWLASFDI